MISKKELLNLLAEGVKREDEIIPTYARHLEHTIEFSGLEPEVQSRFMNTMELLISESTARKGTFHAIKKFVESNKRDNY